MDVAEMVGHGSGALRLALDVVLGLSQTLANAGTEAAGGGMDKLAVGIPQGEKVHKVLDLSNTGRR